MIKLITINQVYNTITDAMNRLENIDAMSLDRRKYTQEQINKTYNILDNFRDELIRENEKIKNRNIVNQKKK